MMRKISLLASFVACASIVAGLGVTAEAASVPSVAGAGPGAAYQCAPYSAMKGPKAGRTASVVVHVDGYAVTFSAGKAPHGPGGFAYPGKLTVSGAGHSWALARPADPKDKYFELGALCAAQLTPAVSSAPPDVLAEGYWGGAHCCYAPTIYRYAAGRYQVVVDLSKPGVGAGLHWDPNVGFTPKRVGSAVVLETDDGAFPYAFGCYACTPSPTRLFTVADGRLVDVTTSHPALVRAEAARAWKTAHKWMQTTAGADGVEGPLAQWAADQCELNQGAGMFRTLEQLQAEGKLAAAEKASFDNKAPFPTELKAFLLKHGYCQGQLS